MFLYYKLAESNLSIRDKIIYYTIENIQCKESYV